MLQPLVTVSQELQERVTEVHTQTLQGAQASADTVKSLATGINSTLAAAADDLAAQYSTLSNSILSTLDNIAQQSTTSITGALDKVVDGMADAVTHHSTVLEKQSRFLTEKLQELGEFTSKNLNELQGSIRLGLNQLVSRSTEPLRQFASAEAVQGEAMMRIADALETISEGNLGSAVTSLPAMLLRTVLDALFSSDQEKEHDTSGNTALFDAVVKRSQGSTPVIDGLFENSLPGSTLAKWVFNAIAMPLSVFAVAGTWMEPELEWIRRLAYQAQPTRLSSPEALTVAFRRGFITEESYQKAMLEWGYDDEQQRTQFNLTTQIVPPGDMLSWWQREFISEDQLRAKLSSHGYDDEDIDSLQKGAFHVPPVADLITMAVREVFTPEIAEKFGQFEDYPDLFTDMAKRVGLTEETARLYWAAHWDLPSPQMGFEMLHRGVIGEDELEMLLKALDVMPYWRDKLTQISYRPLTRVDVRRMHALGILGREDVVKAYMDGGYHPDNAEFLAQFTEVYNEEVSTIGKDRARDLTVSQVLGLYRDHIIESGEALDLLEGVGYEGEDAKLLLMAEDMEAERKLRASRVKLIHSRVVKRLIDITKASAELAAEGLSQTEINAAINDMVFALQEGTQTPSLPDLMAMKKKGIVNDQEFRKGLEALGYGEPWISRYEKLV